MDQTNTATPAAACFAAHLDDLVNFQRSASAISDERLLEAIRTKFTDLAAADQLLRTAGHSSFVMQLFNGYALKVLKEKHKDERGWVKYYQTHLPGIPKTSLYRCLALADKFPDPAKVPKDLSLTDAYRLIGILPEKVKSAPKRASKEASAKSGVSKTPEFTLASFRDDIGRVKGTLVTLLEANSKASFSPSDTAALIDEIAELTVLLGQMRLRLSPPISPKTPPLHGW
jgi:hypothetical protein